jgi:hypothetical protein
MRRVVVIPLALALISPAQGCGDPAASDAPQLDGVDSGERALQGDAGAPGGFDASAAHPDAATGDAAALATGDADARPPLPEPDAGPRGEAGTPSGAEDGSAPDAASCPHAGHITYNLEQAAAPTAAQRAAYTKIDVAMKRAVALYNCHTDITKTLRVQYEPSVPTADGNANGTIRFGAESTFEHTRAMHEIAHTVGVGASSRWSSLVRDGLFIGMYATQQLRMLTGKPDDAVHADAQHFWPYGLNYASEVKSDADLVGHCEMVVALRRDLGL